MKRILVALAILTAGSAGAADISATTTCRQALAEWGSRQPARMAPVMTYIDAAMDGSEGTLVRLGQPPRLAALSEQGRATIAAVALAYCRRQPDDRLHTAAVNAYLDWRDFREDTVGKR